MAINEVKLNGETLLTTRGDTVSPETLAQGETATNRAGEKITGQMDGEVSDAYKITDPVGTISDEDYIPFNDVSDSTSPKKKTLFSAFIEKLKSSFLKSSGGKFKLDTNTDTVDYTSTDIDASRGDNNVSSIRYPSVSNILDRMKRIIMRTEAVVNPNGKIGWKAYVRNYDTDGNEVGQKGMQFHMDKSGNLEYTIDDFNAFRAAIQTADQLGTTIPADSDLNDYMTAGTYRVPDDSTAADIDNLPLPLCGKVVVLDNGNGGLEQVYFPNHEPRILVRSYWSSTWGDWKELELKTAGAIYALIDGSNISDPSTFRKNIKTIDQTGDRIPANSNLNDYVTAGTYYVISNADAATMSNIPVSYSGKLVVLYTDITNNGEVRPIQLYLTNSPAIYARNKDYASSTGAWSAWKTLATTNDVQSAYDNYYGVGSVSGSAITANINNYTLVTGRIVSIYLSVAMPKNATLNVNSTGAKNVYYNTNQVIGAFASSNQMYPRTWTFIYNGSSYEIIGVGVAPTVGLQNTNNVVSMTAFFGANAYQLKYSATADKMKWNRFYNSAWKGDIILADYNDIVHQTVGITVPNNSDLDTYKTNGIYNVISNASAATISNIPYPAAGKLIVQPIAASRYVTQIYTCFYTSDEYRTFRRSINTQATTPTWTRWEAYTQQYNGRIVLYSETTTAADLFVGIYAKIKDTTTGKTYGKDVLRVYQDHNATESYGFNLVIDSGGSTIIGSGESAQGLYNLLTKPHTGERLYLIANDNIFLETNANTIANRVGYRISNSAELIPVKAEVDTDNFGSIGAEGKKLANIWAYKINGKNIVTPDDAIVSNNTMSSVVTSLDDIPLNTAGRITISADISPTGSQITMLYICYGVSNSAKTIELTRYNHANKNSEEFWKNSYNPDNSSWTGWMPLSRQGTYVGTCATAANERAKVANVDADFSLKKGVRIAIKFSNTNTYSNATANPITLNVNGTGAKNIWGWQTHSGAGNTGTNTTFYGVANRYTNYYYDGTYWVWDGQSGDNDSDIRPSAYCETAAGTAAKTAVCTNYSLLSNSYLHVLIRYANTSAGALTLNVNGQGAKPIYINGAASSTSNYTLPAGTYLVFYNGTNYYFRTDGIMQSASNMYFVSRNEYLFANANYVSGTSGSYGLNCAPATDKNDMFQLKNRGDLANALFYNYRVNNIWKGDGLMFNKWFPNIAYCTSSTEAATAAKVATTQGGGKVITLFAGLVVCVVHSVNNTASNCTLNVDGTGAKQIYYNQGVYTGSADWICGRQNMAILYIFDGTYWRWFGLSRNDNSTNFLRNDASSTLTASGAPYLNVKSSSIDMKAADNGVSSTQYPAYIVQDKNGLDMSRYETVVETNGQIRTFIQVCNYNTTSGSHFRAGITIYSNKSQDVWYGMNNPHYFARAIGHGYGTCDTATDQQIKVVSMPRFVLTNGAVVHVKFTNTNTFNSQTATPVQLNVNNTGAKNIWYNTTHSGAGNTGTNTRIYGEAGRIFTYMYDGTYWVWLGCGYEADTVDPRVIGIGYGTCNTAAATAVKVVTLASYSLRTGGYVTVKFDYDVPANATMNINSRGAKNIYYRGVAITAGLIRGGDRATFIYNGSQYDLIGIDRDDVAGELTQTLAANATSVTFTGLPTSGNVIYDVYTSKAGLNYTDMDDSTSGQLKITFEAQSAAVTVYLRYHWIS